jgi:protein translocase SecG subunit
MRLFFLITLSVLLVAVSAFAILIVLMQRSSEGGGFGSSLGGNAMESVFGGEAGGVLVRTTVKTIVAFFLLALLLSMTHIHRSRHGQRAGSHLPDLPESTASIPL